MLNLRFIDEKALPDSRRKCPFPLSPDLPYKYIETAPPTQEDERTLNILYVLDLFKTVAENYGFKYTRDIDMILVYFPNLPKPLRIEGLSRDKYSEDSVFVVRFVQND